MTIRELFVWTTYLGVVYRELNDVHWWQAEYEHTPSGHYLVCGFD